jgi:O-antigen/teichoic acid export membrane protein
LILGYVNKGILFIIILSTEQIGLINLLLSVGMLFSQFANLGTFNSVIKFLPYFKEGNIRKSTFFKLNVRIVFFGIFLFSILAILLKDDINKYFGEKSGLFVSNYFWIIPLGIANVFFVLFESFLRGIHKNIIPVLFNDFVLRVLISLLLFLLWFKYIDFPRFLTFYCLIHLISPIVLFFTILREGTISEQIEKMKVSSKFKRIILNYSLFSYSNTLGIIIVTTMDTLMITYFEGLKSTGIYTTILYLISAVQIPYRSLYRVSEPLVPILWREKKFEQLKELYKKLSSISLVIILYMFLLIWVNRTDIFGFLPKEYSIGIWVFLFLIIGKVIDLFSGLNGAILVTSKKYKYDILFTIVLLGLVFGFNLILIPIYGIVGAAISTSFAVIVYNVGRLVIVWKNYKLHPLTMNQLYVFLIFLSVLFAFELIPALEINPIVSILLKSAIISLVYYGIIYIFKLNQDIILYTSKVLKRN